MERIGIPVRKFFLQAFLGEVMEAQDMVERLSRPKYEALDAEMQANLDKAYAALFAVRVQIDQSINEVA